MFGVSRYSACKVWFSCKMGERTVMEVRNMRHILYVMLVVIALCVVSCTDTASRYNKEINNAERLMQTNADSAMAMEVRAGNVEITEKEILTDKTFEV